MLIPPSSLTARSRQPATRAADHDALVARLEAEIAADAGPEERAAALELRALRQRLADLTAGTTSCATCAIGYSWPEGAFEGGHCCSGATTFVWTDDEVAAVAQGGTRPSDLVLPEGEHAGCAFRGPRGCSLAAVDRPSKCLRFLCHTLSREVFHRGQNPAAAALIDELDAAVMRFSRFIEERREREAELDGMP